MSAHMVRTVEELRALDDGTAFQDSAGDAGVWKSGEVHYPETSPMGAAWCIEQFAPLAVLAPAVDPDDKALVEKVAEAIAGAYDRRGRLKPGAYWAREHRRVSLRDDARAAIAAMGGAR